MTFDAGTLALSFLAGALSTLSPCVLPLLPIIVGTALASHRHGPLALALGLALSFTVAGVLLGSLGLYFGLSQGWLRQAAAVVLVALGIVLLSTTLQSRLARAMTSISAAGTALSSRLRLEGWSGQFVLGCLLGLVWAPCVGPTLGAALTLASQSQALGQVALVMLVFGVGAALPLALVGTLSREALGRTRNRLVRLGIVGKYALAGLLLFVGLSIVTGLDRRIEAFLVAVSPDWLTQLTTRY